MDHEVNGMEAITTETFTSVPPTLHNALSLAEKAKRLDRVGRNSEADALAAHVRRICAQSLMRNLGEFGGWGLRGVADAVSTVGGAIGQGLQDFGSGVVGGATGKFAPRGRCCSTGRACASGTSTG
ncbi:MAG: hypothetical protein H8F28_00605 [Fibrella sp.]|nr:hypothetical protein [Armatimonadota bacterium]